MRVALIAEWLDIARGGAETSIIQFAEALGALGVQIDVFTRSELQNRPGLSFHAIKPTKFSRAGMTAGFIRIAEAMAMELKPDLIHAFLPCAAADIYQPRGGTLPETIRRTIAVRRTRIGRCVKRVALEFNARQRFLVDRERAWLTGPRPPSVIAISRYVVEQLKEHYEFEGLSVRYIRNGVDVPRPDPQVAARERDDIRRAFRIGRFELLILQVCHNFKLKGVRHMIDGIAQMKSEGLAVRALVVGGVTNGAMPSYARRLGVADIVQFVGRCSQSGPFYSAADVMIHPTYYDPCSRVVLEAIARGLPVVTTRFDGSADDVNAETVGKVMESPWAIDEMVEYVKAVENRRCDRTFGADENCLERISMARHAREVREFYDECVKNSGASTRTIGPPVEKAKR